MKRSKFAGLALMGAAPFLLVACAEPQGTAATTAYKSVQDCVDDGIFTRNACSDLYAHARESAPQFSSANECQSAYGNCEQVVTREGNSVFMPAMMGFMVGQMLSGGNRTVINQPIYHDRHNRGNWGTAVERSRKQMPAAATTGSRRGFGSGAAARGGWGS